MVPTALIIGASGRIGTHVVRELDRNSDGLVVRLSSSRQATVDEWLARGRAAVLLDLDQPEGFAAALRGVDRVFLLTGYTAAMLVQSKLFVDAAADAGVSHIVHVGVYGSRDDRIPHFAWHALIETYIEASGIAWTHLHPNMISDSVLVMSPPLSETRTFTVFWRDAPQGWVFACDIGAVAAAVLREGPVEHGGQNYWLSTEVMTGPEVSKILSQAAGTEIRCLALGPEDLQAHVAQIPMAAERAYMESAVMTMRLASEGKLIHQTTVRDDVQTVLGRPGTTIAQWAREQFGDEAHGTFEPAFRCDR